MNQSRLSLLLGLLVLVGAARFWFTPQVDESVEIAAAVPVSREARLRAEAVQDAITPSMSIVDDADDDVPGNAFSVRIPPAPPAPPPAPVITKVAMAVPVLPPTIVSTPPLQVIGTYDDGTSPGVFVATARGTLLARTGTVLLSEYKVTAITPQQITVLQLSTQTTSQLPITARAMP